MDMRKNEKGSSLIFAVVVIMVIAITIAAALAISFSYYNRSIAANSERQAYLTAKSVLTNIVDNIVDNNSNYVKMIPEEGNSNTLKYQVSNDFPQTLGVIDDISVSRAKVVEEIKNKDNVGKVTLDKTTISVSVTYGNQTKIVNADLKKYPEDIKWQLSEYYEGQATLDENVTNALLMLDKMNTINDIQLKSAFKDVLNYLKKDEISWKRFEESGKTLTYYNNDPLRDFFFFGYYGKELPKFKKELITSKNKELSTFSNDGKIYYMQPFFNHNKYEICLVYATEFNSSEKKWSTNLIFYDGSWYYLMESISMTSFNDSDNDSGLKKWNTFVTDTLNNEEKAIKLN